MRVEEANVAVVRAYLSAIERFDGAAVAELLHPDIVQVEQPNKLYPAGQLRGFDRLTADLPRGAQVLQRQSYPIGTIVASGDSVVVETRWEGVLNVPLGRLAPRDTMVAHVCIVFTLKDGRIIRQVNYDCYEEFAAAA